jgi:hypothetical protein
MLGISSLKDNTYSPYTSIIDLLVLSIFYLLITNYLLYLSNLPDTLSKKLLYSNEDNFIFSNLFSVIENNYVIYIKTIFLYLTYYCIFLVYLHANNTLSRLSFFIKINIIFTNISIHNIIIYFILRKAKLQSIFLRIILLF